MKGKQAPIIIGIIVVILAVIAYFYLGKSAGLPGTETSTFTSIRDALSRNVSLKCEYTDEQGNKTVAYVKGGAMRGDTAGQDPSQSMSYIFKDNTMYSWNPNTKEGMMMKIPEFKEEEGEPQPTGDLDDPTEELEQYKEKCAPAVVSDSLFTPPSDVNFQDFSQMMPSQENQGQTQPSQEQIEEMMKQYSNPEP